MGCINSLVNVSSTKSPYDIFKYKFQVDEYVIGVKDRNGICVIEKTTTCVTHFTRDVLYIDGNFNGPSTSIDFYKDKSLIAQFYIYYAMGDQSMNTNYRYVEYSSLGEKNYEAIKI